MIDQLSIHECMVAFWSPGPAEMMVLAVVALLLYGGNLPEVARSWGKSFAEFRRGLSGFQNELNEVIYSEPDKLAYHGDDDEPSRDDSRIVHGYEESEAYSDEDESDIETEEFQHDQCVQDTTDEDDNLNDETAEIDDSEQTVRNVGSDTVVIEPHEIEPHEQDRDDHAST